MESDSNLQAIIENQRLILERLSHIETRLNAVFQIQGDFLKGVLNEPEQRRADVRQRYAQLPDDMIEVFQEEGLNKHRPFQQ